VTGFDGIFVLSIFASIGDVIGDLPTDEGVDWLGEISVGALSSCCVEIDSSLVAFVTPSMIPNQYFQFEILSFNLSFHPRSTSLL
jgi:hypothetical protein